MSANLLLLLLLLLLMKFSGVVGDPDLSVNAESVHNAEITVRLRDHFWGPTAPSRLRG